MIEQGPFPDVEEALMTLLGALLPDPTFCDTVTPADLQLKLPWIRIIRIGGRDDFVTDTARVDVDVFAGGTDPRSVAWPIAERARQVLLSGPHVVGEVTIDKVITTTAATEIPWDDPEVRRWTAAYEVSCRRTPA